MLARNAVVSTPGSSWCGTSLALSVSTVIRTAAVGLIFSFTERVEGKYRRVALSAPVLSGSREWFTVSSRRVLSLFSKAPLKLFGMVREIVPYL